MHPFVNAALAPSISWPTGYKSVAVNNERTLSHRLMELSSSRPNHRKIADIFD
jgi:hypothetical protein